jgi:hypothetical protein
MMGGKVLEAVEFGEHEDARTANLRTSAVGKFAVG